MRAGRRLVEGEWSRWSWVGKRWRPSVKPLALASQRTVRKWVGRYENEGLP